MIISNNSNKILLPFSFFAFYAYHLSDRRQSSIQEMMMTRKCERRTTKKREEKTSRQRLVFSAQALQGVMAPNPFLVGDNGVKASLLR